MPLDADAANPPTFILNLSCVDRPGIVSAMTTELAERGANIAESSQFWDRGTDRFFMRLAFTVPPGTSREAIETGIEPAISRFDLKTRLVDTSRTPRIVIMVSRFDHALRHLLYQTQVGWLRAEVVAVVSNHADAERLARIEDLPFHHLPVTKENKAEQEEKLLAIVRDTEADLVVLARYMQVLSNGLSKRLYGKAINIHHSFLPSFKGAKPYHQAHARGVKLIGATAHYVTPDLDEGPIIEQEVERVTHAMAPDDFVAVGRDVESRVLARAVKMHLESRVMLNGQKTVVFA